MVKLTQCISLIESINDKRLLNIMGNLLFVEGLKKGKDFKMSCCLERNWSLIEVTNNNFLYSML